MRNMPAPCNACPWMQTTPPGALGGSPPETYIGQAYGPFVLPCHKACDFDDPDWKRKSMDVSQCAGAAMFRSRMGISPTIPTFLHSLEPQGPVLDDPVKFYAHHKQITPEEALAQLTERTPLHLLDEQLGRQTNMTRRAPPKETP